MIKQAAADGTIVPGAYAGVKEDKLDPAHFIELVASQPDGTSKSVKVHKALAASLLGVKHSTANRHQRKASDRALVLALRDPVKVRKMVRSLAAMAVEQAAREAAEALAKEVAEAAAGGLPMVGLEAEPEVADDPLASYDTRKEREV